MPPKKSGGAVKWEWETDEGTFKAQSAATSAKLEAAYRAANGAGTVKLDYNGGTYDVDFTAMCQKNPDSGKVRRLRRPDSAPAVLPPPPPVAAVAAATPTPTAAAPIVVASTAGAADSPVQWCWRNDAAENKPYGAPESTAIEAAYAAFRAGGPSQFSLPLGPFTYSIDFGAMQQVNTSTSLARPIVRLGGAASLPPATSVATTAMSADLAPPPLKSAKPEASAPPVAAATTNEPPKSNGGKSMAGGGTKLVQKGKGVVDPHSGMASSAHIYEGPLGSSGGAGPNIVWQVMLNQTNVGSNNNKYYVIQLLEHDTASKFYVFTRWGRVGADGQSNLDSAFSIAAAQSMFASKFRDKTKNDWGLIANNRDAFVKYAGKYQLMDIDMGGGDDDDKEDAVTNATAAGCTLPAQLQRLMKMIGSKGDMDKAMRELEIDTRKMPLGKISKKQIKDAFMHLKTIEAELKKTKPNNQVLIDQTSMFYTLVPHDFGFSHPPTIRDPDHLKRKMEMLDLLADLEVASKLLSEAKKSDKHALDSAYEKLNCSLVPLAPTTEQYQQICTYLAQTHGPTHHIKLQVEEVFTVNRPGETTRYEANYGGVGNKMLLWHGSRTTNFMGILSQGLRIAPPEAPSTGYMFGKGVYFADAVTKSANYCHASTHGILLLCEVALGSMFPCTSSNYMDKPKPGHNSTLGIGRNIPDPAGDAVMDGVKVPMGKLIAGPTQTTTLLYNEFIVYDVSQLRIKYLLVCKFGKK